MTKGTGMGQLGRPSGARFRTYERLKRHAERVKGSLFDLPDHLTIQSDDSRLPERIPINLLNRFAEVPTCFSSAAMCSTPLATKA